MDQNPQSGQERRQYKRIEKHFMLTYFDRARPNDRHEASQLKNISLGGMCLITSKSFPPDTILGIELKTPFQAELTYFEGLVEESREKLRDIIYETRMRFDDLSPQAEFVIKKIMEYFEQK